jgi:hypothetical protein
MRKMTSVFLFAILGLCLGCGQTNRQVFKHYASQFGEKRDQFKKIAAMLPASGSVSGNSTANLSPKPTYNAKTKTYNTEIVMYDQLLDPDIESQDHNRIDLLLSGDLLNGIRWMGPKNPMTDSSLDRRAVPELEPELKMALSDHYLVVLRPVTFAPPVAMDESNYKPGTTDIEGFVVDMDGNKIVGSFRFTANSASQVQYSYKEGEDKAKQLENFAYSSLWTDARGKVEKLLQQATGGEFVLEN